MKICRQTKWQMVVVVLFMLFSGLINTVSQITKLQFRHLTVEDGLSQGTIHTIFQDRLGFMWFGTNLGINKYDGSRFTNYRHESRDTLGLPSNLISRIFEDSQGILWIGTNMGGLCRLDREQEVFYSYNDKQGGNGSLSNDFIRAIFEDSQNNLWIGTAGGGLYLYNRQADTFTHFSHDSLSSSDIGSNFITDIDEDRNGYLWLASTEGIITKYDPKLNKGIRFNLYTNNIADRYSLIFGHIYVDSENNVWCTSHEGLFYYNQDKDTIHHYVKGNNNKCLNEDAVTDILEIQKDLFLITTDHGGINLFNKATGTFTYYLHSRYDPSSLSNDQLYNIYESPDGLIWIGSYQGGVNIIDFQAIKFRQFSDLLNIPVSFEYENSVFAICEDDDRNIWFGYDGQGILIYNPSTDKATRMQSEENNPNTIPGNVIVELYKDRQGDIWIGTYLHGMSRFDWKTKHFTHYKHNSAQPEGIGGNNVWSIIEDREGDLWIGFQGSGLDRYDRKNNKFIHYTYDPDDSSSLSNNSVFKVFEDKSGNIWVSTMNGLCMLDRKTNRFTRFVSVDDSPEGLFGKIVYDIFPYGDDNLWIGTDQSLNQYNTKTGTFRHFDETAGLRGNSVLSITGDRHNHLWLATNKGLSRFDTVTKQFRNYDISDGLQGDEFNYVSVLNASDGRMYFGGENGINFFYPDSIYDNPHIPPVYITGLSISNSPVRPRQENGILSKHINFEKGITLSYKQSAVTFEYAALNYSNSHKNQYAYMLEGFDKDWNYVGNKHELTYTSLNPGKYLLRIKGSNNDGIWNEAGTTLQITILPPWWRVWWFRIILYLSVIGLAFLGYHLRMTFYENRQKKLMALVKERTWQLEEVAIALEEKQEEINSQNEELKAQRDELENNYYILIEQKKQILEQNEELDSHRNQLEKLIEERTKELIMAKEKAEESDRLKSSFLANLSHEIRTPLNAILGFSSLLGDKNITDQEREEYNHIIEGSSNTLLDLISDILDISKIEAGQLELEMNEVFVGEVINDLVDIFDMFMKRDDIGLNKLVQLKMAVDGKIQDLQIVTDNLRLRQILSNLINNAIKFTNEGYVEVGCSRNHSVDTLEFYVKDTGIGIKEESQSLVFERFRKLEDNKNQLHRGTGLGLAISYQLVKLMGGSMRLASKVGEGSIFYFTIPLIMANPSSAPVKHDEIRHVIPDLKQAVLLVAEDDVSNFNYIRKLLSKANARVLHADNGKQVLSMLTCNHDIRLILMDIKMPEMDGVEALHEMQKMNVKIPVIAQTAYALADEVVKLKKEGFDEYISKPIQREVLYSLLSRYLA